MLNRHSQNEWRARLGSDSYLAGEVAIPNVETTRHGHEFQVMRLPSNF